MKNVAVIGSGFAGMLAAVLLSHKGYKVTVFERHYKIGGYGDSFRRKGYQFHTSVYKVPKKWNGLLELVNITFDTNEKVFGKCQYIFENGDSIIPGGNLEKKLIDKFPDNHKEIVSFFYDMKEAGDTFGKIYEAGYSVKNLNISEMKTYFELSNLTIGEVLERYFEGNLVIKEVIKSILDFEDDSIALIIPVTLKEIKTDEVDELPVGGAPEIFKRLAKSLKEHDGKINIGEGIIGLEIDETGHCQKLITEKREYDNFQEVVVASDINYFYDKLLNREIKHEYKNQDFTISESTFSVWLGLDCSYEALKLPTETVYYSIANKSWNLKSTEMEPKPSSDYLFISAFFSKDPLSTRPGQSQLCVGLPIDIGFFEEVKNRGIYENVKEELTNKLIEIVSELIPNVKNHIVIQESASPLTYYDYTLNTNGATIGYQKKKNFIMSSKRHKNMNPKLKNVSFGSQWTSILGGVIGSMEEGIKAANIILKKDSITPYDYMEKLK